MHLPDTPQDSDNRIADRAFTDEWMPELERVMADWERAWGNLPYKLPLVESTGLECWRPMYDDGMSPQDAFWEDQNAWKE